MSGINTDTRRAANINVLCVFGALEAFTALMILFGGALSDAAFDRVFTLVSQIACMGILPFVIFRKASGGGVDVAKHISLGAPVKGSGAKIAAIAFMMIFINLTVASVWITVLEGAGFTLPASDATVYPDFNAVLVELAFIAVLPAIFEEFTFRGILLGAYKESPMTAIILSSLMFALMHANIVQFFFTFVGGVVMGLLVVKTRSIIAGSAVHFAINAFSVLSSYGSQNPDSAFGKALDFIFGPDFVLVYFALVIGMIALTVSLLKSIDKNAPVDLRAKLPRQPLKSLSFLAGAATLGLLLTGFTFYWGIIR
ncbi:MAG: CPBP family intramembrane metalloprotease [Clostridiales bacterium]|jgi:membrane protease YdiL (CAAX protease family)|nr:CPBP family intramembrane metalloprotease [Clostridiales bacterium]